MVKGLSLPPSAASGREAEAEEEEESSRIRTGPTSRSVESSSNGRRRSCRERVRVERGSEEGVEGAASEDSGDDAIRR